MSKQSVLSVAQPGDLRVQVPLPEKKNKRKRQKEKRQLMIFMQQMQYNAPNRMYVFQNFLAVTLPDPLLVL